jgi:hypothetical protein
MDPSKHYLGKVCKHGHEHENSGQGLRRKSQRDCVECKRLHNKNRKRPWGDNRGGWLRRRYGITEAEYDALLKAQGGACAICRRLPADIRLAVDHRHNNGWVRGLLRTKCNQGIGQFDDDPATLARAIEYLLSV